MGEGGTSACVCPVRGLRVPRLPFGFAQRWFVQTLCPQLPPTLTALLTLSGFIMKQNLPLARTSPHPCGTGGPEARMPAHGPASSPAAPQPPAQHPLFTPSALRGSEVER